MVAVHGGPGQDHVNLKAGLAPLTEHVQVVYYDQRGNGRSDYSAAEFWNLRTWADDLRRLCDGLGLARPVVLGSNFGGGGWANHSCAFRCGLGFAGTSRNSPTW